MDADTATAGPDVVSSASTCVHLRSLSVFAEVEVAGLSRPSKRNARLLVVEDDPIVREELSGLLEDEGYSVLRASSAEDGIAELGRHEPSVVITDLKLPGESGLAVVDEARASVPDCPVLVVTAHASVDSAVEAMRRGAFHYLQKPLSADTVLVEVERAFEHGQVLKERNGLRRRLSSEHGLGRILGETPKMAALRRMIEEVAKTDSTVLVTGETGTGKELVANALHYEGPRASGPLVKVNCAALSETLLESELFGHEKGAFTGAEKRRTGRFERASGGTLFLDEISEMGAHVQAKLLRVLQGDPFERVGGDELLRPDVRLVAATNRDPDEAVEKNKLRKDLYYRLNIVRLDVPPLRERTEDVPVLAERFVSLYAAKHGKNVVGVSDDAMAALKSHDWPGNVRELENSIERALVLAPGETLRAEDLPPPLSSGAAGPGLEPGTDTLNLREAERGLILRALRESGWNKARAAERLGIFPSSLYKKMKRFGIPQKRPERAG
jgi:DNA-binding NtrC family response regulator